MAVGAPHDDRRPWDVLLIGGAAGTGKTRVSRRLARHFDVSVTEVDDLWIVLETMTTPEQQPILHYWKTKPEEVRLSAEQILELHISVGRLILPALDAVIANHVESRIPVILEGDYLLPELVARKRIVSSMERVRAAFLYEPDESQIVENFFLREPAEGRQTERAHVSWLYGSWLKRECARYGLNAVPATPWESLLDRLLAEIG